jgi:hypothetical protein
VNSPIRGPRWLATTFVTIATLGLLLTALAKVLTLTGSAKGLVTPDPVFAILSVRQLMALGAGLEVVVAGVGFSRLPIRTKCAALAWLSSLFLFYRFGRWSFGVREPCRCLGDIWQWLPLSRQSLESGLFAFLVAVWVGSWICILNKARPCERAD